MAAALPQCAATCNGEAPFESVWERAVGQHERAAQAARTCSMCEEGKDGVCGWHA